jgi:hypothetical protein
MSGINRKDKKLILSLAQYQIILAEMHKTAAIFSTFISQNG